MLLTPTQIDGVVVVDVDPYEDERGLFARTFDADVFAAAGLEPGVSQCNLSFNRRAGTVRGLHRQVPPYAEAKLIRCTSGAVVDVAVDVRVGSPTFGRHVMVELSAANRRALFISPYVAHGFQSLTDGAELMYQVSGPYVREAEQGFRYDDPAFGIAWPLPVTSVSEKDARWPLLATPRATTPRAPLGAHLDGVLAP